MKLIQTMKALLAGVLLVPLLALGQGGVTPTFKQCSITTQNLVAAGVPTAGSSCEIRGPIGTPTGQVTGTYTAAGGLSVQETVDGLAWKTLAATTTVTRGSTGVTSATITSAEQDTYTFNGSTGKSRIRITALGAVTGTAVVSLNNVPFGGGSGSTIVGGGDASAANQVSTNTKLDTINTSINASNAQLPTALGSQAAAASLGTTASTEDVARTGIITETAPASDTASSGLNGRAQRIAQNLTTLTAKVPTPDTVINSATATSRTPVSVADTLALAPASQTSAATLFTQDMTGYGSISVQVTSAGSSCTITYEASDDNTTWYAAQGIPAVVNNQTAQAGSSTALNLLRFGRFARYFRARVSTYGSGTVTVVATLHAAPFTAYLNAGNVGAQIYTGQAAHDAAISGNPVRIGFNARTSAPATTIVNDDTVNAIADLNGALVVKPFGVSGGDWFYTAAASGISNTTTAVTIKTATGNAATRSYITAFDLMCDALGAATEVAIRDGAAGAVIYRTKVGTSGLPWSRHTLTTPRKSSLNTLLEVVTLTASITGACYFNAEGYDAQ